MNESRAKKLLLILFSLIFASILAATVRASLVRNVFDNGHLIDDVWFQATLLDAYLGFLTFFVWVAWKERKVARCVIWFALIMTLGNMAMAGYVIFQLIRLPRDAGMLELLTQRSA